MSRDILGAVTDGSSHSSRFVGRQRELQVLDEALTAARDGVGSVVLVTGPAGIGKTWFCQEIATRAQRGGFTVACGSCWPSPGAPALWPWQEILEVVGGAAASGLLAATRGESLVDPEPFTRFSAIGEQIKAACARSPLLIVIDDFDRADTGAVRLTRFIAKTFARRPLVLVLTRRLKPNHATADSSAWAVEDEATPIRLRGFDLAETETALRTLGQHVEPDLLQAVYHLTDGHPLHVQRIATAGATTNALMQDGVRAVIAWAVERLTERSRSLLSYAAILGVTPSVAEAATVAAATPGEVRRALAEASAARLVVVNERERFSFGHELIRKDLLDRLSDEELVEGHARAANMLANSGAAGADRLIRLAHHAISAASRSTGAAERAVAASRDAARLMMNRFGYEAAVDLLKSAVAVHEQSNVAEPVAPLLVEWAEAVLQCGRLSQARELFDRAAQAASAEHDAFAMARAAIGLGGMWINEHRTRIDRERVTNLQRRALAELPAGERHLRLRLEVRLAAEQVYQGESTERARAKLDDAERLGDGKVFAEALSLVHHALLTPRHTKTRLRLADKLIAVASTAGEGMLALLGVCWRAVDLFHLGDRAAETALGELRERAEALGCRSLQYVAEAMATMLLIRAGRLAEAEARAYDCFTLGTKVGDADAPGIFGAHLTTIRWLQGRDSEVLAEVERLANSPTLNPAEFSFQATVASLAASTGDTAKARTVLDRLSAAGLANLPESSTWLAGMLAIAEAAHTLGDADLSRQVYDLVAPYAELPIMPSLAVTCLGSAERALGVAAFTFGNLGRAVEHLERSVTANRRLGNRPFTTVAKADLAEALHSRGRPGDRERAEVLLAEACAEAEAMGLTERAATWTSRLTRSRSEAAVLYRHDRSWTVSVPGGQLVVRDRLGMQYLAQLLTNPNRAIPALQLASDPSGTTLAAATRHAVLDNQAIATYRRRIQQIADELDDADNRADNTRSEQLAQEHAALVEELRHATRRGGRTRSFADSDERARTAVRQALKRTMNEIAESDPSLGALLNRTILTGNTCRYTPDPNHPLHWSYVDARSGTTPPRR